MNLPLFILARIRDLPDRFTGSVTLHTSGKEWTLEIKTYEKERLPEMIDLHTTLDYLQSLAKNQQ